MGRQIIDGVALGQEPAANYEVFQKRVESGQTAGVYEKPAAPTAAVGYEQETQEYRNYGQPAYPQEPFSKKIKRKIHDMGISLVEYKSSAAIGAVLGCVSAAATTEYICYSLPLSFLAHTYCLLYLYKKHLYKKDNASPKAMLLSSFLTCEAVSMTAGAVIAAKESPSPLYAVSGGLAGLVAGAFFWVLSVSPIVGAAYINKKRREGEWYMKSEWGCINRADALQELGRNEEAIVYYDMALCSNDKNEYAWHKRGDALSGLGRNDEALICYDRIIGINPYNEGAWINKGGTLKILGKYDEAIQCFESAIKVNKFNEIPYINEGDVLELLGRYEDALLQYYKALRINPTSNYATRRKEGVISKINNKDIEMAVFDFAESSEAISYSPNSWKQRRKKGKALWVLGNHERALKSYNRALGIKPGNVELLVEKGKILSELGRNDEAQQCFGEATRINPHKFQEIYYSKPK